MCSFVMPTVARVLNGIPRCALDGTSLRDDAEREEEQRWKQHQEADDAKNATKSDCPKLACVEMPRTALGCGIGGSRMKPFCLPPQQARRDRPKDQPKRPRQQDGKAKAQGETGLRGHHRDGGHRLVAHRHSIGRQRDATFQVETTSKGAPPSCCGLLVVSVLPVPKAPPNPRQLFAARLKQARALRDVPSQRALGLLMGLEKHVAANRVNRYESQARGIDLDGLGKLAEVLQVPMAYLVAEDEAMADAVLALAQLSPEQRARAVAAILKAAEATDGGPG